MESVKVMHIPVEIAGQVGLICDTLMNKGLHAIGFNYFLNYLNYNRVIPIESYELIKLLEYSILNYDLFHFHNSYTFIEDKRDIQMIREAGRGVIMHHRGNDVRSHKRAKAWNGYKNPYVNTDSSFPEEEIEQNLKYFAKHVSAAIVQDYELYHYVADYYAAEGKKVYVLPRLFIPSSVTPPSPKSQKSDPPLIVHAPTHREFKGTKFIINAVEKLAKEVPLRFKLVEGMSHDEAMELYKEADIVIDQVLCGAYGNLSVEAMALGKAVVCYIRPDLKDTLPADLPILSCNPDTLYDGLKELVLQPELRVQRGQQGIAYVKKHHDADQIILQLISIYEEVLGRSIL